MLCVFQLAFCSLLPHNLRGQQFKGDREAPPRPEDTLRIAMDYPYYSPPAKRPRDFAFRIGFNPYAGDVLDTFADTLKRDLVDHYIKVPFHLSSEQLDTIYQKMLAIDLFNYRNVQTVGELRRTRCMKVFDIKVRLDSVTRYIGTIPCSGQYKQNVLAVGDFIHLISRMMHSSEEYRKLPKPTVFRL